MSKNSRSCRGIGRARNIFPGEFFLTFLKGILLKRHHKGDKERKREGNRLLRSLDVEEGEDNFSKVAALSDLTQGLRRRGRAGWRALLRRESRREARGGGRSGGDRGEIGASGRLRALRL